MKRKTTILDQTELIGQLKGLFNLNQNEMNELMVEVKRFDPKGTGYISKYEVDDIMRGTLNMICRLEVVGE